MTPREFESVARKSMSSHFKTELRARDFVHHPKTFDLVSEDGQIVGDAKFYSMVRGQQAPPAKWSVIAAHVWFLEKTKAQIKFLVFGNDRRVTVTWIQRWGKFVAPNIDFYFLAGDKDLELLPKYEELAP